MTYLVVVATGGAIAHIARRDNIESAEYLWYIIKDVVSGLKVTHYTTVDFYDSPDGRLFGKLIHNYGKEADK